MRVHAITSWGTACGIAAYAEALQTACQQEGLDVEFTMDAIGLDPTTSGWTPLHRPDVLWLNYHAGLHSRWTPNVVTVAERNVPVVVTIHDTRDGTPQQPNDAWVHALMAAATATIIHEPCADLEGAAVIRQGIPDLTGVRARGWSAYGGWDRPVLGTVGFPFPWKNYDRLAQLTASIGWGLLLIAPHATGEDVYRWRRLNPWLHVFPTFLPAAEVPQYLAGCTATAFMYECANTGTSGAIRQGIAARRPVYALATCRQFRDLRTGEGETAAVRWVHGWDALERRLRTGDAPEGPDPAIVALAERDSWRRQARAYLGVFREAMARWEGTR